METKCPRCGATFDATSSPMDELAATLRTETRAIESIVDAAQANPSRYPPRFNPADHPAGMRVRVSATGREYVSTGVAWREDGVRSSER